MDESQNKKALTWLTIAHFANDTYSGFLNPIMPFIAAKIGITMAIATVIMSIAQVCASMIQPIFGFFADNIVKRVFIFWGLIFGSLFVPIAANAPNVFLLTLFKAYCPLGLIPVIPRVLMMSCMIPKTDIIINIPMTPQSICCLPLDLASSLSAPIRNKTMPQMK